VSEVPSSGAIEMALGLTVLIPIFIIFPLIEWAI